MTGPDPTRGLRVIPAGAGVGQNIKTFVQQYSGEKVRTTGQKVKMRYYVR
jgi:hypothetical protein